MQCDVAIVGAGLSGLWLANVLQQRGRSFVVLEARNRVGGRILSRPAAGHHRYDLGSTWFWPGQPRMAGLVKQLGIEVFEQHGLGALVYEHRDGRIQSYDFATMAGSFRLVGGMAALSDALAVQLAPETLRLGSAVEAVRTAPKGYLVGGSFGEVRADRVVLAAPPRIVAQTIVFEPALPQDALQALKAVPTWMASHAKIVAVYPERFWRDRGLSGDGISQIGPLAEIHDASPASGEAGALFGFAIRKVNGSTDALRDGAIEQLRRMFGREASAPSEVYVQNWAKEPFTATDTDDMIAEHPNYGPPPTLRALGPEGLVFASSEMGITFGGYLEGALEAAEAALVWL